MKKLIAATLLATFGIGASSAVAVECGNVVIAEMNWPSAELMANVDKIILEKGYGCSVEKVPGATTSTFASMNEKGTPDIAPELWINGIRNLLERAKAEGRLHTANDGPITGLGEGWWIPPYTKKAHPEFKTVLDIIEHPELFPYAEDPSKGAFYGCPAGWACQHINTNLFKAFKMAEKGWVLVDPGSAAGLDGAIAKANERGENWFGYYWSPTSIIGKYNMQLVPFGVPFVGNDHWNNCIVVEGCPDPKPSAWTKSEVNSVITDKFMKAGGPAVEYIKKRVFPGPVMNSMLVYMGDNQADGVDAAYEFLAKYPDVWTKWVSPEAAEKIKSGL